MKSLVFSLLSQTALVASVPPTLLDYAGATLPPSRLSESVLVIVDAQREYVDGKLRLVGIDPAVAEARVLLDRARRLGVPVIHVIQEGKPGAKVFAADTAMVESIPELRPLPTEIIVRKRYPSSFAGTTLLEVLQPLGRKNLIVIGFMTHMCVSTTVRAALDHGYRCTVVASACASRDLPAANGTVIAGAAVHEVELAALRDRFTAIAATSAEIAD